MPLPPVRTTMIGLRAAAGLALVLTACGCAPETTGDPRPLVVVSVAPYGYFVESLAGGAARVMALLPPGASPAGFEPGLDALRAIEQADLLVRVGHPHFPFETAWLDGLLRDRPDLPWVDATAAAPGLASDHDPHSWLSPSAAAALVKALTPALGQLLDNPDAVTARSRALLQKIDRLDAELADRLAPVRGGRFLVLHPAWGHFANHYGLEQVAIERDGKPPGPRQLATLLAEAERTGYRSVIVMPQTDPGQARGVAEVLGAQVVELDPLSPAWPESMRHTARLLAQETVMP